MAIPYEASIHLTGINAVSPMLGTILREVLGIGSAVDKLGGKFKGLEVALKAAGVAFVGDKVLHAFGAIAEHGEKLLDQQDKMRRAGIAQNDILALQTDFYNKISLAIPTTTAAEYLKTVNELRAVTGSTMEAAKLAPKAVMVDTLLANTFGRDAQGDYYKLLRSEEMKGVSTDPKRRGEITDAAFAYITGFGGKLTAQDFQTFAKRAGAAWINMKPEAFGPVAVTMADLGGASTGTALQTLQQLQQGTMTLSKQQGETLQKAGLLDMSKVKMTGFGGSKMQLVPGAILGSLQYSGDLPGWVKNVIYPHMLAAAGGDRAVFKSMLGKEAPNRNAQKLIAMFGDPGFRDQIAKDLGLASQVKSIPDAYQSYVTTNPMGVKKAFNDQYESMMQAIGAPLMQAALPVMKGITEFFTATGTWANAHPDIVNNLLVPMAGIAATMTVLGTAVAGVDYASRTGSWEPWHGAKRVGIGAHEGFGMHHVLGRPQHESAVPPARGVHVTVISPVHLDGRIISKNTERHLVHRHQFAHGTADHDGRAGMPAVDYMSIA